MTRPPDQIDRRVLVANSLDDAIEAKRRHGMTLPLDLVREAAILLRRGALADAAQPETFSIEWSNASSLTEQTNATDQPEDLLDVMLDDDGPDMTVAAPATVEILERSVARHLTAEQILDRFDEALGRTPAVIVYRVDR